MKFETINNQLCRMVEPEPLTDDVKFPCVVRLIQDDSPMGRNNDFYATSHLLAHIEIINGLDAIHFVRWQGSKTHYSRFEIIGYPVADGSAEWALYHVLHKERRALTGYVNDVLVHIQNTEYGIGLYYSGKIMPFDFITPEQFIEGAAHTGWQLYEPQPEPKPEHPAINGYNRYDYIPVEGIRQPKPEPEPKFAVGDWVEFNPGSNPHQVRIVKVDGEKLHYIDEKGYQTHIYISAITRKLKPSEVIVNIGCLSGTVRRSSSSHFCIICGDHWSMIAFAMLLDTATRELVKALLKAQEGE